MVELELLVLVENGGFLLNRKTLVAHNGIYFSAFLLFFMLSSWGMGLFAKFDFVTGAAGCFVLAGMFFIAVKLLGFVTHRIFEYRKIREAERLKEIFS